MVDFPPASEPRPAGLTPGPYTVLLGCVLLLLIGSPLIERTDYSGVARTLMLALICAASIFPVRHKRVFVSVGGFTAVLTVLAQAVAATHGSALAIEVALAAGFAFFLHAAFVTLLAILNRPRISIDDLAGGISAYLLIGISGAFIFAFIDHLAPGSIAVAGGVAQMGPAAAADGGFHRPFGEFLYFSFTCLTTLGFGDLVPVTPGAQVFAYLEAVIGQVYLTVLVARLVGLHLIQSDGGRGAP